MFQDNPQQPQSQNPEEQKVSGGQPASGGQEAQGQPQSGQQQVEQQNQPQQQQPAQQPQPQGQAQPQQQQSQPSQPQKPAPKKIKTTQEDRMWAAIGYVAFLGIVTFAMKPRNEFCKKHAAQGLVIFAVWFLGLFLLAFPSFIAAIGGLVMLGGTVLAIIGIVMAIRSLEFNLPVLTDIAKKIPAEKIIGSVTGKPEQKTEQTQQQQSQPQTPQPPQQEQQQKEGGQQQEQKEQQTQQGGDEGQRPPSQ